MKKLGVFKGLDLWNEHLFTQGRRECGYKESENHSPLGKSFQFTTKTKTLHRNNILFPQESWHVNRNSKIDKTRKPSTEAATIVQTTNQLKHCYMTRLVVDES